MSPGLLKNAVGGRSPRGHGNPGVQPVAPPVSLSTSAVCAEPREDRRAYAYPTGRVLGHGWSADNVLRLSFF